MMKGFVSMTIVMSVANGFFAEIPTSLAEAVRRGDMKALRGFLEDGESVEAEGSTRSAVGYALIRNQMGIYRYLRDIHGADVNSATGSSGWIALNHAINSRRIANVRQVLNDGSFLEVRLQNNWTPLFQSIHAGDVDVIRELINRGADIQAFDERGFNPLMAAIFYGQREIALELIALGSAVNVRQTNARQETLLTLAVGHGWEDVATALVEAGADVDAGDYQETTPLIIAAKHGYVEIVRMLIANHADVNRFSKSNEKYCAILAANIKRREINMELTRLLLEEGHADPNLMDSQGMSLLHRIAESGIKGIAALLIRFGARVDVLDRLGRTPKDIARSLVQRNCRLGSYDRDLNEEWIAEFG